MTDLFRPSQPSQAVLGLSWFPNLKGVRVMDSRADDWQNKEWEGLEAFVPKATQIAYEDMSGRVVRGVTMVPSTTDS